MEKYFVTFLIEIVSSCRADFGTHAPCPLAPNEPVSLWQEHSKLVRDVDLAVTPGDAQPKSQRHATIGLVPHIAMVTA